MEPSIMKATNGKSLSSVGLLSENEPSPATVFNRFGRSPMILTCEHAGNRIPNKLGTLGLNGADLKRHIAWDIGAESTARHVAELIDAPLVIQQYSRLVIDCNRPKHSDESIPIVSDGTAIPGNEHISVAECEARYNEIHLPFHKTIENLLDDRVKRHGNTALVALHSFTPALENQQSARPWDIGLLYNRDNRLAVKFELALLELGYSYAIGHNEPYSVCDETDYTLPVHGEQRGIYNVLLEVRNDHICDRQGISTWSNILSSVLRRVEHNL
jgi:predicted N-formylglutamate amidohydrolase